MITALESLGGEQVSTKRMVVVAALTLLSLLALLVPYSSTTTCTQTTLIALLACVFHDAAVATFRTVPIIIALVLVAIPGRPRGSSLQLGRHRRVLSACFLDQRRLPLLRLSETQYTCSRPHP
jgi:hypothetical protein